MAQLKRFFLLCLLALVASVLAAFVIGSSSARVQAQVVDENPPRGRALCYQVENFKVCPLDIPPKCGIIIIEHGWVHRSGRRQ
jgi:hypothetical protein